MIRLMVVDDHEPTRQEAIKEMALDGVVEVVAHAETSDEAYKVAQAQLPDVVLLDLHLPGLLQIPDLIKRLVGLKNCKVIMFASEGKASEIQDLLDYGYTRVKDSNFSFATQTHYSFDSSGKGDSASPNPAQRIKKSFAANGHYPRGAR